MRKYFTTIKITFLSLTLFIVGTLPQLSAVPLEGYKSVIQVKLSKIERFMEYLWDINEALKDQRTSEEYVEFAKDLKELRYTYQELYAQLEEEAAREVSHLHTLLNTLPRSFIPATTWPHPEMITKWLKEFESFENLVIEYSRSRIAASKRQVLIKNTVTKFSEILAQKILTNKFFGISSLDSAVDAVIGRPTRFVKKHPYLTAGIVIALSAGVITYWYMKRNHQIPVHVRSMEEWMKDNGADIVLTRQTGLECGVWALYFHWCHEQATTGNVIDMDRYTTLANDAERYAQFKARIEAQLRAIRPVGYNNSIAGGLENNWVHNLLTHSERLEPFSFRENPLVVECLDNLEASRLEEERIRYSDGRFYPNPADIPAGVIRANIEVSGLRHDDPLYTPAIRQFNAAPGNHLNFVLNTVQSPADTNLAHFINALAINDPTAPQGIRLRFSDSMGPRLGTYEVYANRIRALLQPLPASQQ